MKYALTFALLLSISCLQANASSIILSNSNTDPSAALDLTLNEGDSGVFYVWVQADTGQTINSLGLDILTDNDNLTATDFVIETPGFAFPGSRWNETQSGTFATAGKLLDNGFAFSVNANGINQGLANFDNGTVVNGDTFLHAALTFTADSAGVANLVPAEGSGKFSDTLAGQIFPQLIGGSITVEGSSNPVIPEPTTAMLVALGLAGFASRRRV